MPDRPDDNRPDTLLTAKEAADRLRISTRTLSRRGWPTPVPRRGREALRYRAADVEAALQHGAPPDHRPSPEEAERHGLVLLTVDEVAALLRLTEAGVYSLVAKRKIPHFKISNRLRFDRAAVVRWLTESRVPPRE